MQPFHFKLEYSLSSWSTIAFFPLKSLILYLFQHLGTVDALFLFKYLLQRLMAWVLKCMSIYVILFVDKLKTEQRNFKVISKVNLVSH